MCAVGARFLKDTPYKDRVESSLLDIEILISGWFGLGVQFVLATKDGQDVGMFAFVVSINPTTAERTAYELVWYVDDGHRGKLSFQLLRKAEQMARERGAEYIQLGAWSQRLEALYERLGYEPIERIYQKRL